MIMATTPKGTTATSIGTKTAPTTTSTVPTHDEHGHNAFVPCFFVVVLAAPHYRRFVANTRVKTFVQGVTAGAVGAVAGSVVVLARRALIDLPTVLVFGGTLLALWRVKKLPEPVVIALSAVVGIVIAKVRGVG
jgi:chromate transport protein ChrA